MNNWFISPFGDILLLAVASVVLGVLIAPYVTTLVTKVNDYITSLDVKNFFSFYSLRLKLFKKLGDSLNGWEYHRERTYHFVYGHNEVYSDSGSDIIIETTYGKVCLDFDDIDIIRQNINKAVRDSKAKAEA